VHGRPAPLDRLAYLAYVSVARDEKTAIERGRKILKFVETTERIEDRFVYPPGMLPPEGMARFLKEGKVSTHRTRTLPDGTPMSNPPTPQEQILNHALFAGTPDQVYRQIESFWHSVGGFGQLLVQMGGTMAHDEICDSLTLFANEVQPRLARLAGTQQSAAA
jgi:alkanesulfonate monooxygenase SsuD/methylene tetrahydromethanopterin reductase-like flavin-dependent oxidoreductase (luciferase family)